MEPVAYGDCDVNSRENSPTKERLQQFGGTGRLSTTTSNTSGWYVMESTRPLIQ